MRPYILLREVRGEAHRKTYKSIYEAGRLRKRRVYRVPTCEEVERAIADLDATAVELGERRRA